MASKRANLGAAALLVATAAGVLVGILRNQPLVFEAGVGPPRFSLILLPGAEARELAQREELGIGLAVYPASRDPALFLLEMARGAPSVNGEVVVNRLASAFAPPRVLVSGDLSPLTPDVAAALRFAFNPGSRAGGLDVGALDFRIFAVDTAEEATDRLSLPGPAVVLGIDDETPLLVGLKEHVGGGRGVLTGSMARRPGILTPYDLAVTIVDLADEPMPSGLAGNRLRIEPDPAALEKVNALSSRLERDDSYAPGLAAVAVGTGGLLVIFGWLASRLRRTALATRLAQAAVFVLPGWVLAEFIPSSAWGVRAIPIFAGALLGAVMKPRDPIRTMARVGFGSALVFAVLVAIAPINPGGEPGLSIWGNPLVSWRFFGVQNVQAAIIASGIVVWGVLAGLAARALAVIAVAAAVVTGAPAIGANFVGVLTFVFGGAVAITALVRRRASLRQLIASGTVAVGAFVLALLADAGSPVSHGGRAARRISSDGWSATWDLIEGRLRLNVELIGDFSGGWIFVALLLVTLAALIVWGLRTEQGPLRGRVAVLAGALMALASMVLEDSGFYSGAVLWFVAADAWLLVNLAWKPEVTPPTESAPHDAAG